MAASASPRRNLFVALLLAWLFPGLGHAYLGKRGAAVLFISHRLEEVFEICQTVTVMRDGTVVHDGPTADITPDELVRRMVGRDLDTLFPKAPADIGQPVLAVRRLTREGGFTDISFEVRAGEIVALSGLVGAGRSEVARAIFGIDRADAGHVEVAGQALARGRPVAAMRAGLAFVPEDRRQQDQLLAASWGCHRCSGIALSEFWPTRDNDR